MHVGSWLGARAIVIAVALCAALVAVTAVSDARVPAVTIGRITSEKPTTPDVQRELKSAVVSELGRMDLSSAKERFVLSASLVTLETVTTSDQVQSKCVVTAELARKKGGTLRAVFRGSARAIDAKDAKKTAELAALRAAVRTAIKRLPEAVR